LLSYALGDLGAVYAAEGRTRESLYLTRRALEAPTAHGRRPRPTAGTGRRAAALGPAPHRGALKSYGRAIELIEASRSERVAESRAASQRFRETVAPVYVDYVDALLQSSDSADAATRQALLVEARAVMEHTRRPSCATTSAMSAWPTSRRARSTSTACCSVPLPPLRSCIRSHYPIASSCS
jgi:hypothetical protein